MKTRLEGHFNELSATFKRNIGKLLRKSDKKSIHALRVTIKRFRSFLLFLEYLAPEKINIKKSYRKLKNLFSEAGKVRNLQVEVAILNEFSEKEKNIAGDIEKLKSKIQNQRAHFKKELGKFDEKKMLGKLKSKLREAETSFDQRLLKRGIQEFATANVQKALALADENSFHKARRHLKDAHYVLEITGKDSKAAALINAMDPIEKSIGRWQDWNITSQLLERADKQKKEKNASGKTDKIQIEIGKEIATIELQIQSDFNRLKKLAGSK